MAGIDMNKQITFLYASLRSFLEGERHCKRLCREDVIVLVYDGILRFREDGVDYEIYPGQYFIQKHDSCQDGPIPSDSPQYLFVHFLADWSDDNRAVLPRSGNFDYQTLKELIEDIAMYSYGDYTNCECTAKFYELLSILYRKNTSVSVASRIADYISKNYLSGITLDGLSEEFHFSKNHIINIFSREYGMTPFEYINSLRIKKAEWMLEVTTRTAEAIALECGFNNYSHFYKTFRQMRGISPTDWRERKRIIPMDN